MQKAVTWKCWNELLTFIIWQARITSGEMADCDRLGSTFSGPLFSGGPLLKNKRKQQN
jgi:hypothetical protein